MFSNTTIALSTSIPTAIVRPPSVRRSKFSLKKYIKIIATTNETGMLKETISVLKTFGTKIATTMEAHSNPKSKFFKRLFTALCVYSDWSIRGV